MFKMTGHIFTGKRFGGFAFVQVDGVLSLDPRLDLANHSPTGFEWGYGGSGPTQLSVGLFVYWLQKRLGVHEAEKVLREELINPWPHLLVKPLVVRLPREWFSFHIDTLESSMRERFLDIQEDPSLPERMRGLLRDLLMTERVQYVYPPYPVEDPVFGMVRKGVEAWRSHPLRRESPEENLGSDWTLEADVVHPKLRISRLRNTGEVYAELLDESDRFILLAALSNPFWKNHPLSCWNGPRILSHVPGFQGIHF